jgi:hypothetical protein
VFYPFDISTLVSMQQRLTGDTVYDGGEVEMALRRAGKGIVPDAAG